jgi:hypothetical protein
MVDIRREEVYATVSTMVSAGDGIPYDLVQPQPPRLGDAPQGAGVSSPGGMLMLEMLRRLFTNVTSPSATLVSGGSAGAVALTLGTTAPVSGFAGMLQGVPFFLSAAGTLSAQPSSAASTTSNQIRKVLVTVGMSALPAQSSLALGGGTLQFVIGSAMLTSAGAITSGGPALSYFDLIPLPVPSANEVPVGWLNIPNNFAASAGISNTMMWSDYRALQGMNFSAMMQGLPQP